MVDFSPLIIIFATMMTGFIARRFNLLKDEHINALPGVLLNIAYPALIITSVSSVNLGNLAGESMIVIISTFIITLMLYFTGKVTLTKYENYERKPILVFNLAIGNITYVVLPVIKAVFGDIGVYYAVLHSSTQDILIWTLYYVYFQSIGGKNKLNMKKLISPCSVALMVSVILAAFKIELTVVAEAVLNQLSGLTVPLALIYIGGVLGACTDIRRWMPDKETIILSFIKVVFLPLLVYGLMICIGAPNYLRILMALVFSAPATLMSTVWAKQFDCDYEFSIKLLFFSTVIFLLFMIPFFRYCKFGLT